MVLFPKEFYCSSFTGSPDLDWITANQFCYYEQPAHNTTELIAKFKRFFTNLF